MWLRAIIVWSLVAFTVSGCVLIVNDLAIVKEIEIGVTNAVGGRLKKPIATPP